MRHLLALILLIVPALASGQTGTEGVILRPPVEGAAIDPASLSDEELLELIRRIETRRAASARPVGIFGIPSGFGAPRGLAFAALAATNRRDRRRAGDWDASLAFGIGLGDAQTGIGVTPLLDITSVTPNHFGSSGKLGVKLSRRFAMPSGWLGAAALSLSNLVTWGDSKVLDRTWTLAATAVRPGTPTAPAPLMLTAGFGTGVSDRGTDDGAFAGAGIGLGPRWGLSMGWFGDEAIAAVNLWPRQPENVQISVGIGDITNRIEGRRLLLAISVSRSMDRFR